MTFKTASFFNQLDLSKLFILHLQGIKKSIPTALLKDDSDPSVAINQKTHSCILLMWDLHWLLQPLIAIENVNLVVIKWSQKSQGSTTLLDKYIVWNSGSVQNTDLLICPDM